MQAEALAKAVADAIALALAPLRQRVAALEAKGLELDYGTVRERIAVLETRAPVPGPAGADGAPGTDGAAGLGFDDLLVEHDGDRGLIFKMQRGDTVKEIGRATLPAMIYRGIYQHGMSYTPGDVVTYGGSAWHCQKETAAQPDTAIGAGYWKLMVKRGDRGKDLRLVDPAPAAKHG